MQARQIWTTLDDRFLNEVWFLVPNLQWILLALVLLCAVGVYFISGHLYLSFLKSNLRQRIPLLLRNSFTPHLQRSISVLWASLFFYLSIEALKIPLLLKTTLSVLLTILASAAMIRLLLKGIDNGSQYVSSRLDSQSGRVDDQLIGLLTKSLKVMVVVLGVLLMLQAVGFNVMSVLAGLGLGGLTLALAAQDTAKNVFGSLTLTLDKPFKIGQHVRTKGVEGLVEEIGLRCTRIRTFENSLVSIPNSELVISNIENMDARGSVRVRYNLGLTYDTPLEKIEIFCEGVKQIIKNHPSVLKEKIRVYFNEFSASSLDVQVTFYLLCESAEEELESRHQVGLGIVRLAAGLGVDFAFPTQTLHVASTPEQVVAKPEFNVDALLHTAHAPRLKESRELYTPFFRE